MPPGPAVEAVCPELPLQDFLLLGQQDVGGSDISCGAMGNMTLAGVARLCQAAAGCAAFTQFPDNGRSRRFCLKSVAAPLIDASTTNGLLMDPCAGAYVRSESCMGNPLMLLVRLGPHAVIAGVGPAC